MAIEQRIAALEVTGEAEQRERRKLEDDTRKAFELLDQISGSAVDEIKDRVRRLERMASPSGEHAGEFDRRVSGEESVAMASDAAMARMMDAIDAAGGRLHVTDAAKISGVDEAMFRRKTLPGRLRSRLVRRGLYVSRRR